MLFQTCTTNVSKALATGVAALLVAPRFSVGCRNETELSHGSGSSPNIPGGILWRGATAVALDSSLAYPTLKRGATKRTATPVANPLLTFVVPMNMCLILLKT